MENNELFKELEKILTQLSIDLKFGRGYFNGGLFRYKEQSVIYLNRAHSIDRHIEIITNELKKINLENMEINPGIREYLERPE